MTRPPPSRADREDELPAGVASVGSLTNRTGDAAANRADLRHRQAGGHRSPARSGRRRPGAESPLLGGGLAERDRLGRRDRAGARASPGAADPGARRRARHHRLCRPGGRRQAHPDRLRVGGARPLRPEHAAQRRARGGDHPAQLAPTGSGAVRTGPGGFPVVLAADVLYERRDVAPLLALVERIVAPDGLLWLAEPGRAVAGAFVETARAQGWAGSSDTHPGPWPDPKDAGVVVTVHQLRRS